MTAIEEIDDNNNNIVGAQKFIMGLIFLMPVIMVVTLAFAWWQYPEPYEFFQEFISNLGGRLSDEGFNNSISSLIMIIGFTTVSLITLAIAIVYFVKRKDLKYWYVKGPFALLLTIGAAGIAIPKDQPSVHILHGIGAFLFILGFAMFNFAAQLLRFRKTWPKPKEAPFGFARDATMTILVFVAMILFLLFYLLELVANVPEFLAELGQKIVLIVDLIAVYFIDIEDL